jgi:hypothetical protein
MLVHESAPLRLPLAAPDLDIVLDLQAVLVSPTRLAAVPKSASCAAIYDLPLPGPPIIWILRYCMLGFQSRVCSEVADHAVLLEGSSNA